MPVREYTEVRNPRWANAESTHIDCEVFFVGQEALGFQPYTAAESDPGWPHSEEIFARAAAGDFGTVAPYVAPPAPIPAAISRRQFFQALASAPYSAITKAEALAAVRTGALPAQLNVLVALITDEDERFEAEMLLAGATEFQRAHPRVASIATAYGWSTAQTDDFFRFAGNL